MKLKALLFIFSFVNIVWSQNLTISSSGQTGTSGTNWSISGTNPVIISATGTANVNTSVIMGYLNTGTSVIAECLTSNGSVFLGSSSAIVKNTGGDATLTFKAANQAIISSSISSTSSKLNIVLWSDFNNNNIGGVAITSAINTNGGHFWAGGSSSAAGSYTWNGLIVGNGPSVGSNSANNYAMDLFSSSIATGGGDILLWAGAGSTSALDGMGLQNNPHLNAGSGNVTLITRQIFNVGNTVSITSTGKLTLTTDSNNPWTSAFNWSTTTAGSNVTLTSALGQPLQINNFSSLGGLSIGVYDGFGSSFSFTNNQNITINSSINIPGPINVYGGLISLGLGVEVIASTANGSMNFQGKSGFSTLANSGSTRGKLMTTGGGDITISADSDNNNSGTLDIDWLTIDGNTGDVLLEAAAFIWNTGSQVTLPEFYGTGALTIRTVPSANYGFNTAWIALFNTKRELNLGRVGNNEVLDINPCTVCHPSAINASGNTILVAGPININARSTNINLNLTASAVNADILVKANDFIIIHENKAIRTNNGDITLWSNANGITNATEGDFIGFYSGVSINSANGATNQLNGGGAITIAGGTTSQTLPSGTVVPTDYAYSNRTTNWVGLPPGGVNFGANTSANGQLNTLNIYSGGGNIVIKGRSNSSSAGVQLLSGSTGAVQMIHSGSGTVTIDGSSTSSTAHGIEFNSYASVVFPTITSSNTTSSAINIKGEASSSNTRAGYQGSVNLIANGVGGGIEINGKVAAASSYGAIEASGINASALSGPITFIGEGGLGLRIGGNWGKGNLASSSSNVMIRANVLSLYNASIVSSGKVIVEPLGSSFSSAVTFPPAVLSVSNTITGLTIGKSTNTANITLSGTTSVSGPITIFGGDIAVNSACSSTVDSGHINLLASGDISITGPISTQAASLIAWSDRDGNASGRINFSSNITTNGGHIYAGGGLSSETQNGFTVPTGYAASSNASFSGISVFGSNINSNGGAIRMKGTVNAVNGTNSGIIVHGNTSINSGAGSLSLFGLRTGDPGSSAGLLIGSSMTQSISTGNVTISSTSGNIYLEGRCQNINNTYSWSHGFAIVEYGGDDVTISSTTGNISLVGDALSASNFSGEAVGFVIQTDNINGLTRINTDGGSLSILGISGNTGFNFGASFRAANTTGNISFGDPNTGAISLRFGSLSTANSANIGTIAIQSTSEISIEGVDTASFAQAIDLTTEFSFASTASRFKFGSALNTQNLTIRPAINIAGPININAGTFNLFNNLTSSNASDITINALSNFSTGTNTRRTIQSANGNILINADSDANGTGQIDLDYLTINPGSGNTIIRGETFSWASAANTDKPYINGTGNFTLESNDASFGAVLSTLWFDLDQDNNGMGALTIGKSTNSQNTTIAHTRTAIANNGPITIYGQNIVLGQNLNVSKSNAAIQIQALGSISVDANDILQTNGGNISFRSNSGGTALSGASSIVLNTGSTLLSQGGNITLGGNFTGAQGTGLYATSGNAPAILIDGGTISAAGGNIKLYGKCNASFDDGIRLRGIINTTGAGLIELNGEAHGGNNGTEFFGGITFGSTAGSTIETDSGSIILNGLLTNSQSNSTGAINFYRSTGATGQTRHINLLSKTGTITINADRGTTGAYGIGQSSWGDVFVGSPSSGSWTAIGDIVFNYSNLVHAGSNGFKVKTTGAVTYQPIGSSFVAVQTFPANANYVLAENASSLTIGKPSNISNITIGSTTTIAGPITIYGGTLTLNENLASSNGNTISLFANGLSIATGKTITSIGGQLILAPQTSSNTIGLGGAAGTLALPATYFSSNFSDGFSSIQIGSNTQSGNISANAFTLRDNMLFLTTGSLALGGKPILGSNNVTLGSTISSITGSNSNYFQTNGSGKMISTLANNASRIFPVGNTFYNPVTITNKTGNSDTFSVRTIDSVSGNGAQGNAITTPHVKATWDISKNNANTGSGIDMQFSWQSSQEIGGITNFVLNHHNGTVWEVAAGASGIVSGTTTKTITHAGYTGDFSPFAFGGSLTALPIELKEFNTVCKNDYTQVTWTTASEKDNDIFELYKSLDANTWTKIYTVKGQGTKATETSYSYDDIEKQSNYYRLKDIDFNGVENWSQIIFADCKTNTSKTEIYPNPATDYINVSTEMEDQSIMRILNLDCREVKSLPLISKQTLVDIKSLVSGVYIIEIIGKSSNKKIKLFKQ